MITQELLKTLFNYNPLTGDFTRIKAAGARGRIGDVAGCLQSDGYNYMRMQGKLYKAHRVAWLYIHGQWPKDHIDHINSVRNDNRLSNLREATPSQNMANTCIQTNNSSGLKGVSWCKYTNKWRAQICINNKRKPIGRFIDKNDAHKAYCKAADKYYREFANYG
jgi:hypothetical protein